MKNLTADLLKGYVNGLECEAKKAVFEILSLEDIETVFEYGCQFGAVSGFIYYHQTEEFFDKYANEVLGCLQNYVEEWGCVPTGMEIDKNNLTWLFVEETVKEMVYDLELE